MILHIHRYTTHSTKNLLEITNEYSKAKDTKATYKTLLHFYTLRKSYQKEKLRKQSHLQSQQKNTTPNKIFKQEGEKKKKKQEGERSAH